MKFALLAFLILLTGRAVFAGTPEVKIPENYLKLVKTADLVEVVGTNDLGGQENFSVHDWKALKQFVQFLTDDRYITAPKDLKPQFKSLSVYKVRLSAKGALVLEFKVIAGSILDLPDVPDYYVQGDRHSDNIMAPLLKMR